MPAGPGERATACSPPRPLGPLYDLADQLGGELLELCARGANREELFRALLRQVSGPGPLNVVGLQAEAGRAYCNYYAALCVHKRFAEAEPLYADGVAYCDDHDIATYGTFLRSERTGMLEKTGKATERALRVPLRPVLAVVAAGYLAALGYGAAQPAVPAMNEPLATWLAGHGYTRGLAGYWQAGSTTLDAGARVTVSSVGHGRGGRVVPGNWETSTLLYDPSRRYADFVVVKDSGTYSTRWSRAAAERTFGPPQQTHVVGPYTIMTWHANLLAQLGKPRT